MKLTNNDVQTFAQSVFNTFDLSNFCLNEDVAIKELRDEIVTEWDELNSNEVMKSRHGNFQIPKTKTSDYCERLLDLGEGKKVLYGIRHMGGNRDVPFVQFTPNFPIRSHNEALEIYKSIKSEFRVFNPLYLSFWTRDKIDADFFGSTYMVSTSQKIKELSPWDEESGMAFEDISNDSYYDWYKRGYEEFHADFPDLEKKVTVNSADLMRDSLEQGLLKFVTIEGERIGLIAAEKSDLLGHEGIYFHEIYIEKKWRGKGFAKAIQRKFVDKITQGHEFIWGTIDSSNLPSYKTAFSNGRRPTRLECFITLQGELK